MRYHHRIDIDNVAHSSSGLGHHPLKVEITGSNPVCATINIRLCRIRYAERGAFV